MASPSRAHHIDEEFQGACVILDLVTHAIGWDILKSQIEKMRSMFEGMSYKVLDIPANTEMDIITNLLDAVYECAETLPRNAPIVFFLCGKLYKSDTEHSSDTRTEILAKFKGYCEKLFIEGEPNRILIQHAMDKVLTEDDATGGYISNTFPGVIIDVNSTILGTEEQAKKTKSLFLESLVDTLKRFSSHYDVVQLFNKITYDVELTQYQQPTNKESDTVFQEVEFNIFKLSNYKLTTVHSLTSEEIPVLPEPSLTNTTELKTKLQFQVMKEFQDPHRYKMSNKPRGYCIIINSPNNRIGSRIDEMKMKNLFEELFFEVNIIRNQSHQKIKEKLKRLAEFMPNEHQALIVFLMAHGGQGGEDKKSHVFQDVEGGVEESAYIYETFDGKHCKALINRPKIYIVQTCFGGSTMKGIGSATNGAVLTSTEGRGEIIKPDNIKELNFVRSDQRFSDGTSSTVGDTRVAAHENSDMLIFNATLPGHKSYRTVQGSYVIRAIDEIFRQHCADDDIQNLLTTVCGKIAKDPITGKTDNTRWQQPVFKDVALNAKLFLNPGFYKDNPTCYHPEAKVIKDDTFHTSWFDTSGQCVIDVNKHSATLRECNLDTNTSTAVHYSTDSVYRGRVVKGVSLDKENHLVLLNIDDKLTLSVIHTSSAGGHKTWNMEGPLDLTSAHPIAICEVYRDAVGVFTNRLDLQIFGRNDFLDKWSKGGDHIVKLAGQTITHASVAVVTDKVLVLDHDSKTVIIYDIYGNILHTLPRGQFNKPCGLTTDQDNNAAVVCADGLYIYTNNVWSRVTMTSVPGKQIRQMCCNSAYTVCVFVDIFDMSTVPHVPPFMYGVRPKDEIMLPEKYWRLWPTSTTRVIAAGSDMSSSISLIDVDGVVNTHATDLAGIINSGLYLAGECHAVIVADQFSYNMKLVDIHESNRTCVVKDEISSIENPISLFGVNSTLFGVLCSTHGDMSSCINILDRRTRALSKTISLGYQDIGKNDTGCVDMEGNYFVTSYDKCCVRKYDTDGLVLHVLGIKAGTDGDDIPGELWYPCKVLVDMKNALLIPCIDGSVHKYTNGDWSTLSPFLPGSIGDILFSGNRVYSISGKQVCFSIFSKHWVGARHH